MESEKTSENMGTSQPSEPGRGALSSDGGTSLREVLARTRALLLPKYGEGETRALQRFMVEQLKGWTPVDLAIRQDDLVSDFILGKVNDTVNRLLHDEPIQQIFGCVDFYGLKLKVTRDTLVPRPETAELVDIIVRENDGRDLRVLDAGTGSGCIAVALALNLKFPEVTAIDISDGALAVARENARQLHVNVDFRKADIIALPESLPGMQFDIIVSNPPYIAESEKPSLEANVLDYEPATALFVPDSDPLRFYNAILRAAATDMLVPGGRIYFEINPLFASKLLDNARQAGFADAAVLRDSEGRNRFLTASKSLDN